jgi:hypothetical protein
MLHRKRLIAKNPQIEAMSDLFDQPGRTFHELEAWRIKEIKQSIKEADAGEFASDADLAIATKKYAG